jgi:hypothetical protein
MVRYPAVLLLLLSAGCASVMPLQSHVTVTQPAAPQPAATTSANTPVAVETPEPAASQPVASQPVESQPVESQPVESEPAASQPAASQLAARPAGTSAAQPASSAGKPPLVKPVPQPVLKDAAPIAPAVAASRAAAAVLPLDLHALRARLKATKAIGVFTKISLKNKVDDLMKQFTEHYQGKKPPLAQLRLSYDLLMMKVLSLLQDKDQTLASEVVSSREAIWALLADEKTFFALQD